MTRLMIIALVDSLYWPLMQLSISFIFVRLPAHKFSSDNTITRLRTNELVRFPYRRLQVHLWKKWLPDGALLVGGHAKHVNPFVPTDVSRFMTELRRAELAHWVQLACAIPCWLWNPIWASLIMTGYAIGTNLPCIAAQRYNRILLSARTGAFRRG